MSPDRTILVRVDPLALVSQYADALRDWLQYMGTTPARKISEADILHQARGLATHVSALEVIEQEALTLPYERVVDDPDALGDSR